MKRHNGIKFKILDDILYGIDAYMFEHLYLLHTSNIGNDKFKKSFSSFMILFDLEGGFLNWLKNRDCLLEKEPEIISKTYISYIINQIEFVSQKDDLCEDKIKMFIFFINSGIYDNIFLSFDNREWCVSTFTHLFMEHFRNIDYDENKIIYDLSKMIIDRIRNSFNNMV